MKSAFFSSVLHSNHVTCGKKDAAINHQHLVRVEDILATHFSSNIHNTCKNSQQQQQHKQPPNLDLGLDDIKIINLRTWMHFSWIVAIRKCWFDVLFMFSIMFHTVVVVRLQSSIRNIHMNERYHMLVWHAYRYRLRLLLLLYLLIRSIDQPYWSPHLLHTCHTLSIFISSVI